MEAVAWVPLIQDKRGNACQGHGWSGEGRVVLCDVMWSGVMWSGVDVFCFVVLCCVVFCCVVLCCVVLCCVVLCCVVLCCVVLCCVVLWSGVVWCVNLVHIMEGAIARAVVAYHHRVALLLLVPQLQLLARHV